MLVTFLTTLKVLIRDRSVLLWAVAFPLIMSTLFYAMFSNLDENYQLDPLSVVIVEDVNYADTESFATMIDTLSSTNAEDDTVLLLPRFVADEEAALAALSEGSYLGYIRITEDGSPLLHLDTRRADSFGNPSQAILMSILDRYVQNAELITTLIQDNPALLMDPAFIEELSQNDTVTFTERVTVTAHTPSDSLRYFYAVLAFSTIMMITFALTAMDMLLGNTSPLGARRSLGGQSKVRMVAPTLAAAWLLSFCCVLVGFLYLRYVFGVDFGGNEPAVVLTLAISCVCSTFLGSLLGAIPLPVGVKSGFVAVLSVSLSFFAGLYGPPSQEVGDWVARELPWISALNPVRQVADAFFSLYYYDGYAELGWHLQNLLILGVCFFIVSVLVVRRQRYASL